MFEMKAEYILHRLREDVHEAGMSLMRLACQDYHEAMRAAREARAILERELEIISFAESLTEINAGGYGGVDKAIEIVDRLLSRLLHLLSDMSRRGDPEKAQDCLKRMQAMIHNAQLDIWRYERIADGRIDEAKKVGDAEAANSDDERDT